MAHNVISNSFWRLMQMMLCGALAGALLTVASCSKPMIENGKAIVDLDGTKYTLDIVANDKARERGLGGVAELPQNGGMIFVFPDSKLRAFVMRDCLINIDIIFLDSTGRIVAMHHMKTEEPQGPDETAREYENRLPKYSSRYSAKYAIEIAGGLLETMNLQNGQLLQLDTEYFESIVQ